jgi:uncharacterized protein (DUF169 family)
MKPLQTDLSIFKKFKFEKQPVAINYYFHKPEGVERLDKSLGFCEMVKEAQVRGKPFYFDKDTENCVGKMFLGMIDGGGAFRSDGGELGVKLQVYQTGRANLHMRSLIPHMEKGAVNYVVYTPFDKIKYEPDVFVVVGSLDQAEVVLRSMAYSTGDMYESRTTAVASCAQLYIYPYLSGKINYLTADLAYGMKGRKVFPGGWTIVSIPQRWLHTITQNLKEMEWVPGYNLTRDGFVERDAKATQENIREAQNP